MNFVEIYNKAEELYSDKNFSEALDCFEVAYILNPSNTVLNYIGCCYIGLERLDKAIELFETLIYSTHWEAPLYNLGRIYLKLEKYSEALNCFNEALLINSNCDNCYFYMGVYYQKTDDFKKAIMFYEKATEYCSDEYDTAMYYTNMGICYMNMFDDKNAINCFDKAIKVCERYEEAYVFLKKLQNKLVYKEVDQ